MGKGERWVSHTNDVTSIGTSTDYKEKNYYYRMRIVIREKIQSIWALTDVLLTWFLLCDCVSLLNPYICNSWGDYISYRYLIDWCIIIPFYWNHIVHMPRDEIGYKLGTWRSYVLEIVRCYDYKLGTWRSFVLEIVWFYDSHWDRLHRHVKIVCVGIWTSRVPHGSWNLNVFLRSIMYIRLK